MAEQKKEKKRPVLNTAANVAAIAVPGGVATKGTAKTAKGVKAATGATKATKAAKAGGAAKAIAKTPINILEAGGKGVVKAIDTPFKMAKMGTPVQGGINKVSQSVGQKAGQRASAKEIKRLKKPGVYDSTHTTLSFNVDTAYHGKDIGPAVEISKGAGRFDTPDMKLGLEILGDQAWDKAASKTQSAIETGIGAGIGGTATAVGLGSIAANNHHDIHEQQIAQREQARKTKGVKGN